MRRQGMLKHLIDFLLRSLAPLKNKANIQRSFYLPEIRVFRVINSGNVKRQTFCERVYAQKKMSSL